PLVGRPIFAVDLAAVRRRLAADPWVAEAVVRRRLPDRIEARVVLRQAAAVAAAGGRTWLLDREGAVITEARRAASPALVQIRLRPSQRAWVRRPEAMRRCLRLAEAIRARGFPRPEEVRYLGLDERGDPVIVATRGGIEILLGRGGYGEKLDRLARILPDLAEQRRRVARIDLRFRDQAVVRGPG
ncbi:MAG: FtsQ-type POTRA domain-containing protein, partial [Nitrospirae bacterium]